MSFVSYSTKRVFRQADYVKVVSEPTIHFYSTDNESIKTGTPKWWDDYLLSSIRIADYDIYFICSCTIPHNYYNRLTDYKHVWGLNQLAGKGICETSYLTPNGKTYIGIIKDTGENSYRSNTASTILLIPKDTTIDAKRILEVLQLYQYNFSLSCDTPEPPFQDIVQYHYGSLLIHYSCDDDCSIAVYGNNCEKLFNEKAISMHNNQVSEPVYRKP